MIAAPTATRPMVRGDIDAVLSAWEQLMAAGHDADPRFAASADGRKWMRQRILHDWFGVFHPFPPALIAEDDGQLVGWINGQAMAGNPAVDAVPTARIHNMWVSPTHRRRGIGGQLVRGWAQGAKDAGYPSIEVGTLALDARAVGFWKALGFGDWKVILRQG